MDKNMSKMSNEELNHFLQKMKEKYDTLKSENNDLKEKYHRQLKKEKRLKDDHKQAVLQAETVNMMTKY